MTGRDFNHRYRGVQDPRPANSVSYGKRSSSSSGGYTARDTSYIITPEDAAKKAERNAKNAERMLVDYGDMLEPSERANLEQVVATSGAAANSDLKQNALMAFGRMAEVFDRPFQAIRHTAGAMIDPHKMQLRPKDYLDIFSGNDAALIERHGVEAVGEHGDTGGSQILQLLGIEEAETTGGKVARFAGAMAIETILDPMTWFTGGFSGVGKKAALASMEATVDVAVKKGLRAVAEHGAETMLRGSSDDAVKLLEKAALEAGTELEAKILREGTETLRNRLKNGKVKEAVEQLGKTEMTEAERTAKLNEMWLDEVDNSFGVNRTGGTVKDGRVVEGFSWKREVEGIDPKTGKPVVNETPFNVKVKGDEGITWYGKMMNDLTDVIGSKTFHNPKKYSSWDAYLDHVNKGFGDMWTTGGITFGFGKWQKELPGLTEMTRGSMSRLTRPLLNQTRRGPVYERWLKWRQGWSREGTQMILAARQTSTEAASYAEWRFMRSTAAMTTDQIGLISSLYRAHEIDNSFVDLASRMTKELPRKEREEATELIGRVLTDAVNRNDHAVNVERLPEHIKALFTDEHLAEFKPIVHEYADLMNDTFQRAKTVIKEFAVIDDNPSRQAYSPLLRKGEVGDTIEEMFFNGRFPIDEKILVDLAEEGEEGLEHLGTWFETLTKWGRENGWLNDNEVFSLDHLHHLMSLSQDERAKSIVVGIGERSSTRTRTFANGASIVYWLDEGGKFYYPGVQNAFEDQMEWSRKLAGFMHAVNEVHELGFPLKFNDVLETNPMVRINTYIGQLHEAIFERVAWAEAARMGRAAKSSWKWDTGMLLSLGAGHNGFYHRLSKVLHQLSEVRDALVHYRDIIGESTEVTIDGVSFPFSRHLTEHPEFKKLVDLWKQQMKGLSGTATERGAQVARKAKVMMQKAEGMTEEEALTHVQAQIIQEVMELHQRTHETVHRLLTEAFTDTQEVMERNVDVVPVETAVKLDASFEEAVAAADSQMQKLLDAYAAKAMGGKKPPMTRVELTPEVFDELINDVVGMGSSEAMRARADMMHSFHTELDEFHPMKARAEMHEKVLLEAAKLQEAFEAGKLVQSPVREFWSGFQGGVDRAALAEAVARDMKTGGFAPTGFRSDEGRFVDEMMKLAKSYGIKELDAETFQKVTGKTVSEMQLLGYQPRTVVNVELTDGTVIVFPGAGSGARNGWQDPGTIGTLAYAMHGPDGKSILPKDYSLVNFHEDFHEVAPGVWLPRNEEKVHKPVIVVSYVDNAVTPEGVVKGPDMTSFDGAVQNEVQSWARRHEVGKVNFAGPRARKEIEQEFISDEFRYGATIGMTRDLVDGSYVPAVEIKVKPQYGEPLAISGEMSPSHAEAFYWGTVNPIMKKQGVFRDQLLEVEVNRITREMAGAEEAQVKMYQVELDALTNLKVLLAESEGKPMYAARRPVLVPNSPRTMTLPETIEATQVMLSVEGNLDTQVDNMTIEGITGMYRIDPYEMMMVNQTEMGMRDAIGMQRLKDGRMRARPLEDVYQTLESEVGRMNEYRRERFNAKQRAAGLEPDDAEWQEFTGGVTFDRAALDLRVEEMLAREGVKRGSARGKKLEREFLIDRFIKAFGRDESLYEYSNRVMLEGVKFKGVKRPPMRIIKDIDTDEARKLLVVWNSPEVQRVVGMAELDVDDLKGVTDLELLRSPERLDRIYQLVRQVQDPDALADPSMAINVPEHLQPRLPVSRSEVEYKTVLLDHNEVKAAYEAEGREQRKLLAEAFVNGRKRYEEEVRNIARMRGWEDADTASLASLPGPNGTVQPGLWKRLMEDPSTAAEMRRIGAQAETDMRLAHYDTLPEEAFAYLHGDEKLSPDIKAEKMRQIEAAVDDYGMLLRQMQVFQSTGATTHQADRWLIDVLGIPAEHLRAARTRLQKGEKIIPESAVPTYSERIGDWLEQTNPRIFEEYADDVETGQHLSLSMWIQEKHPGLLSRFKEAEKKIEIDEEAAELAAELDFKGGTGTEVDDWMKWMTDSWEAVMRDKGMQREEAFELLHYFHGKFSENPDIAEQFLTPEELQNTASGRRGQMRNVPSDPGRNFADSTFDDSQLNEILGVSEGVNRSYDTAQDLGQAFDTGSNNFAGELSHGSLVSDLDKIYASEVIGGSVVFPADGRIRVPQRRLPKKHVYESPDYMPTIRGQKDYTVRPGQSAIEVGGEITPPAPVRREPMFPGVKMAREGQVDVPASVHHEPLNRGAAYDTGGYRRGTPEPTEMPAGTYLDAKGKPVRQELSSEKLVYPEDRPREMLTPDMGRNREQTAANLDYINPETGAPEQRILEEAKPLASWDEEKVVIEAGSGVRVEGVDIEKITRKVVRWLATDAKMGKEELIHELRAVTGKHYVDAVAAPLREAVAQVTGHAEVRALAESLGVDWYNGFEQWRRFSNTGNPAHLGDAAYRVAALGNLVRQNGKGYGDLILDHAHRLNEQVQEFALQELERLGAARQRELEETGVRRIADESMNAAADFFEREGKTSKAALRRELGLTDGQAEKLLVQMEEAGLVTPKNSSGRRKMIPRSQGVLGEEPPVAQSSLMDRIASETSRMTKEGGGVSLYRDEQMFLKSILGEDVPQQVTTEQINEILTNRRALLEDAQATFERLKEKHHEAIADRVVAATGQPKEVPITNGRIVSGLTTYRQMQGDIMKNLDHVDAIVVTTNGYIGRDGAVMGAGFAKTISKKYPEIQANLTKHLRKNGNVVGVIGEIEGKPVIAFPVKPVWGEELTAYNAAKGTIKPNKAGLYMGWATKADPQLIGKSTYELVDLVDEMGLENVVIGRPGAGAGELSFDETGNFLNGRLDDRFIVAHGKGKPVDGTAWPWSPNHVEVAPERPGGTTTGYGYKGGPNSVNVGRTTSEGVVGKRSKKPFGNPFINDPDQKVKYRNHIFQQMKEDPKFALDVRDLRGKELLCPGPAGHADCHAETLADAAEWAWDNVDSKGRIKGVKEAEPKPKKMWGQMSDEERLAAAAPAEITRLEGEVEDANAQVARLEKALAEADEAKKTLSADEIKNLQAQHRDVMSRYIDHKLAIGELTDEQAERMRRAIRGELSYREMSKEEDIFVTTPTKQMEAEMSAAPSGPLTYDDVEPFLEMSSWDIGKYSDAATLKRVGEWLDAEIIARGPDPAEEAFIERLAVAEAADDWDEYDRIGREMQDAGFDPQAWLGGDNQSEMADDIGGEAVFEFMETNALIKKRLEELGSQPAAAAAPAKPKPEMVTVKFKNGSGAEMPRAKVEADLEKARAARDAYAKKLEVERNRVPEVTTPEPEVEVEPPFSPEPVQVAPEMKSTVRVDPSPEGRRELMKASETVSTYQNEIRRLEKIADRAKGKLPERDGELVADAAFGVGSSPIPRDIGSSIRGWSVKHPNEVARLGDPEKALNIGRSSSRTPNELGYPPGFLSSPYVHGMDRGRFAASWQGKRHPLFGQYTAGPREGLEGWVEHTVKYQFVDDPVKAAALFHETLWDWIETNPDEAKRIAQWLTEKKPNLYVITAPSGDATTPEVDVVAEAFAAVSAGVEKRPSNRWANVLEGAATGEHAKLRSQLDAETDLVRRDIGRRIDEADRALDDVEGMIADRTIDSDQAIKDDLLTMLNEVADENPKAVVHWLAKSEEVESLIRMRYGPEAKTTAVLLDGKPVIQVKFPGSEVEAVNRLSEDGLMGVLEQMSSGKLSRAEAVKQVGPEIIQLHEAWKELEGARDLFRRAKESEVIPEQLKPTAERVVEAEVAADDYTTLMRHIWASVSSRDPEGLREFIGRFVNDELIPSSEWTRIRKVLKESNPALLEQVTDFVRIGLASDMPMDSEQWTRRLSSWIGETSSMNVDDSTLLMGHYLDEMTEAAAKIPTLEMTKKQVDRMIASIDELVLEAYQTLTWAKDYTPIAEEVISGLKGPVLDIVNRFNRKARELPADQVGQRAALIDNLTKIGEHLDNLDVDPKWGEALQYTHGSNSGDTLRFNRGIQQLRESLKEMLENPMARKQEIRGTMVPAEKVGLGGVGAGYVIDHALGTELAMSTQSIRRATTDRNLRHIMRTSQKVWAWWRRAATISRPAFHIRNFIGGIFNNFLIGVNPASYFKLGPDVLKFQHYFNAAKSALEAAAEGGTEEAARKADQAFFKHVLSHISEKNRELFYNVWKHDVLSTAFAQGDLGKLPGRTWVKPWKPNWVPFKAGGTAMESVEGLLRVAAFAKYFDKDFPYLTGKLGKEMVHAVHFDYVNLTPMEERIKKFVPFYVWSRRNIPLQIRTMMQSPRWMISVNRAKRLWNDEFAGPDDEALRDMGFIMPYSRQNELGWAHMMWMPDLPLMDVFDSPLFEGGTRVGNTPFGSNALNPQKWALYGMQLAGPALTIPYDFMKEDDRTTNAPTGINEMMVLAAGLMGKRVSSSYDVKIPWFVNSAMNSAVPFYHDYRAAVGAQANNPYRAAREGMLPGEQQALNMPGDNMALGAMRTFGRGAGFSWATPMDEFFANREIERLLDEYRFRIQTRLPEGSMSQVTQLEALQTNGSG